MSLAEFFNMGGYAFYVWASYALAAILLITNILVPKARFKLLMNELDSQFRRQKKTREKKTEVRRKNR